MDVKRSLSHADNEVKAKMNEWNRDNAVCVCRLEVDGWPTAEDFRRGAYDLLRAMAPDPQGRKVLIKPNVVLACPPDSGIVTHPAFVGGILDYLEETGVRCADIAIAEASGIESKGIMKKVFRETGYERLARDRGIELIDLNLDPGVRVPVPEGCIFSQIGVARCVAAEGRYVINAPKLKTHNLAVTSLCIKNLQGTVVPVKERHLCAVTPEDLAPDRRPRVSVPVVGGHPSTKPESEQRRYFQKGSSGLTVWEETWSDKICDLNTVVRPDLHIVEGIVGRDGTGFTRGDNHPTGLIVAGGNPVAVDTVASTLVGFDPRDIGYLVRAGERGLGPNELDRIEIYELRDGHLRRCTDLTRLTWHPPFTVIRGWEDVLSEDIANIRRAMIPGLSV